MYGDNAVFCYDRNWRDIIKKRLKSYTTSDSIIYNIL